jgi:hypothetical protein
MGTRKKMTKLMAFDTLMSSLVRGSHRVSTALTISGKMNGRQSWDGEI